MQLVNLLPFALAATSLAAPLQVSSSLLVFKLASVKLTMELNSFYHSNREERKSIPSKQRSVKLLKGQQPVCLMVGPQQDHVYLS